MNYPTNTWQELNWNPAYGSNDFFDFCSNVTNLDAPENITLVDYALANFIGGEPWTNLGNYANYVKQTLLPLCDGVDIDSTQCFGTQNGMLYAENPPSIADSMTIQRLTGQMLAIPGVALTFTPVRTLVFFVCHGTDPILLSLYRIWRVPSCTRIRSVPGF